MPYATHCPLQLCKYQEQSQLLDVWLESIVGPLASLLRQQAVALHTAAAAGPPPPTAGVSSAGAEGAAECAGSREATLRVFALARLLNVLVTVRGYKTVVSWPATTCN